CETKDDCKSGVCNPDKLRCTPGSCSDHIKNDSEAQIDCRGTFPVKCAGGKTCGMDADCQHSHCISGICCAVVCDGVCQTCATGACALVAAGGTPGGTCPGAAD